MDLHIIKGNKGNDKFAYDDLKRVLDAIKEADEALAFARKYLIKMNLLDINEDLNQGHLHILSSLKHVKGLLKAMEFIKMKDNIKKKADLHIVINREDK